MQLFTRIRTRSYSYRKQFNDRKVLLMCYSQLCVCAMDTHRVRRLSLWSPCGRARRRSPWSPCFPTSLTRRSLHSSPSSPSARSCPWRRAPPSSPAGPARRSALSLPSAHAHQLSLGTLGYPSDPPGRPDRSTH